MVLAICTFFVVRHGARKSTSDEVYHIEDVSSITKIYMADKLDNKVLLERVADDTTWLVDGQYPASQPKIAYHYKKIHHHNNHFDNLLF